NGELTGYAIGFGFVPECLIRISVNFLSPHWTYAGCDATRTGTRLGHYDWVQRRRSCPNRLRRVRRGHPFALAGRARRLTTRTFHMSTLAPQVVWPSSVWVDQAQRRRRVAASATFWAIVAAGAGVTIAAAVNGAASVAASDGELWILAALAVAADL